MGLLPLLLPALRCAARRHAVLSRSVYSQTGIWEPVFTPDVRVDVENHWREKLKDHHVQRATASLQADAPKCYVLCMFPYPSGALHMGHVRVYTISDTMARFHRLAGRRVIHPMGWDAFGLPAENAAIERGRAPRDWTYSNIASMRKQLDDLSLSFDWDKEFATCDPEYYRWTQHIFLQMYEAGLVYRKEAPVNWDPVDQTVLADEQIDEFGRSWRSGAVVEKKLLHQWYIKTTAFSKSLIDGLQDVNADQWRDIISLQHHWIGQYNGVRFEFPLKRSEEKIDGPLSVFTLTPEAVFGASHILLSTEHPLNKSEYYAVHSAQTEQTPIELTVSAVHPLTGGALPMFISLTHHFGDHLDCHLGIPSCSTDDETFAKSHGLVYEDVLDNDLVINSGQFSGLTRKEAFEAIASHAKNLKCGGDITSERARDWLISRQRYWGTPIPMMHCPRHGTMPVPYEDLPVRLPEVTQFTGKGESPLAQATDWLRVKCPKCDGGATCFATRETDTMDTFVDSSWYFLRYLDASNTSEPFSAAVAQRDMPVDLYIGGKEHAIMHLYYARFFHHFLYEAGRVGVKEPFVNLLTQGMVMGRSLRLSDSGRYLPPEQVDFTGKRPVEKGTGARLIEEWEKMSKSKYNGVDPKDVLAEYGVDATRLCILSNVAPKSDRKWSNDAFRGVVRWQNRIWTLVGAFHETRLRSDVPRDLSADELKRYEDQLFDSRNYFLKEVTFHIEKSYLLSVAISRLQGLTNILKKMPAEVVSRSSGYERSLSELVIMLSPFAPLFSAELWSALTSSPSKLTSDLFNWDGCVLDQRWPTMDEAYRLPLKVKVDGCDVFSVPLPMAPEHMAQLTREAAIALATTHPQYAEVVGDRPLGGATLLVQPGVTAELDLTVGGARRRSRVQRSQSRRTDATRTRS